MPSSIHNDHGGARSRGRDLLRTVAEGTAGAVGDEFLRCLVRHVGLAFDAKFAFVAEATDEAGEHVRVVSGWYDGDWMNEPLEYDTQGKPCALVVERAVVAFPDALTKRFPAAKPAIDLGLESYLAICLRPRTGRTSATWPSWTRVRWRPGTTTWPRCASSPPARRPSSNGATRPRRCAARARA